MRIDDVFILITLIAILILVLWLFSILHYPMWIACKRERKRMAQRRESRRKEFNKSLCSFDNEIEHIRNISRRM